VDEILLVGHHHDCPEYVPGAGETALNAVFQTVTSYVVWPSESAAVAFVLWVAATHAQPAWHHASRFVLKSPIKRCGKTRAQEIARELVHEALPAVNISPAALVHSLEENDPPTLLIDEADTIFGRRTGDGSEDLRGILNAGHSRGWPYVRWDPKAKQREECPTFAMALVGGIGDLPDTIEDRAVVVAMRRRAPGEPVKQLRSRDVPRLHELRGRLHDWVLSIRHPLADAEPALPVDDRQADVWEPLIAVADAAGGNWPDRARAACRELCSASSPDDGTIGERLLADLYGIWRAGEEHLHTTTILERLKGIEDAPWAEGWGRNPRPLNARILASLLRPYGVSRRSVRVGDRAAKGYAREDLADCWDRYVPGVTRSREDENRPDTCGNERDLRVTPMESARVTASDLQKRSQCDPVTHVTDTRPKRATDSDDLGAHVSQDDIEELFAQELGATVLEERPS
jgi:hypothetical protein